jgi:hypothetical protein
MARTYRLEAIPSPCPLSQRERGQYSDVVLERRLRETVQPLVPGDLRFENAEKFVGMAR